MEEEKRYKTPNGKILTESSLRQRFGEDFGKLVATGQFVETTEEIQEMTSEEVTMPTYVAPNGKEFTENELKDRFGNQWEDISVQFEKKIQFKLHKKDKLGIQCRKILGRYQKKIRSLLSLIQILLFQKKIFIVQ